MEKLAALLGDIDRAEQDLLTLKEALSADEAPAKTASTLNAGTGGLGSISSRKSFSDNAMMEFLFGDG